MVKHCGTTAALAATLQAPLPRRHSPARPARTHATLVEGRIGHLLEPVGIQRAARVLKQQAHCAWVDGWVDG